MIRDIKLKYQPYLHKSSSQFRMRVDRFQRDLTARLLRSPAGRLKHPGITFEKLLLAPRDLRTADHGFWEELSNNRLLMSGALIDLTDHSSIFDLDDLAPAVEAELNGFGWLNDLKASENDEAFAAGHALVVDWVNLHPTPTPRRKAQWQIETTARRLISWLSHCDVVFHACDPQAYHDIRTSMERQADYLQAYARSGRPGLPRLHARIAMMFVAVCVRSDIDHLPTAISALESELTSQMLLDGGHVSRNMEVLPHLLLDLLPLRQCFKARKLDVPEKLDTAIEAMLVALRACRLGDGSLARFNGVGRVPITEMAAVSAYDQHKQPTPLQLTHSKYARLTSGDLAAIIDVGSAPQQELSAKSHAGSLSFEFSVGAYPLIVNCGHPSQVNPTERLRARGTAAHSTLVINNSASALLLDNEQLVELIGAPGISGPANVHSRTAGTTDPDLMAGIVATHDGYVRKFGLVHQRSLWMSKAGDQLVGIDELERVAQSSADAGQDRDSYAIRFHLHPHVQVGRGSRGDVAICRLPDGQRWQLSCDDGQTILSLEESHFFVGSGGFAPSIQIVLRGTVRPELKVPWRFTRVEID